MQYNRTTYAVDGVSHLDTLEFQYNQQALCIGNTDRVTELIILDMISIASKMISETIRRLVIAIENQLNLPPEQSRTFIYYGHILILDFHDFFLKFYRV